MTRLIFRALLRDVLAVMIATGLLPCLTDTAVAVEPPTGLVAEGHDSRVDLVWDRVSDTDRDLFNIYRAEKPEGPWRKLNETPHTIHIYSDFIGENGKTYHYRVTRVLDEGLDYREYLAGKQSGRAVPVSGAESAPSSAVTATTREMGEEAFLDSVQKAFFRYFWEFGHPVSGLAREGFTHPRSTVTTGGTGFGMITIMVGAERGFVSRERAAERLLKMVAFLEDKAERYHGIWPHHLRGDTGETIPFAGEKDNGGELVESAFLLQGMLTVRAYFDRNHPVENELRRRITRLWREAEWDWYLREEGSGTLYWHWSPEFGWAMDHPVEGWNECQIAYLLAMASPTHPIPADCYYRGWVGEAERYVNGETYYGIEQPIGRPRGGPLFFTHYSYIGMDPRALTDAYTNYYDSNRAIARIHHRYTVANPNDHEGYGELVWGLTASQNPDGYKAHQPAPGSERDDGTIAPTAAISSFPYTPRRSMATLRHFYHELGPRLWGAFGFHDAFNPGADWVSPSYLAIDQGPMAPMIENHRTGLPWKMFMSTEIADRILQELDKARPVAKQP